MSKEDNQKAFEEWWGSFWPDGLTVYEIVEAAWHAALAIPPTDAETKKLKAELAALTTQVADTQLPQGFDEAVEAAARAYHKRLGSLWDETHDNIKTLWCERMNVAIRAALPHLWVPLLRDVHRLVEASKNLLLHAGIADADPRDVDEIDRRREREMIYALAPFNTTTGDEAKATDKSSAEIDKLKAELVKLKDIAGRVTVGVGKEISRINQELADAQEAMAWRPITDEAKNGKPWLLWDTDSAIVAQWRAGEGPGYWWTEGFGTLLYFRPTLMRAITPPENTMEIRQKIRNVRN